MKSILLIAALAAALLPHAAQAKVVQRDAFPQTQCASQGAAFAAAQVYALLHGGTLVLTSGTPSMEPLIHGKTYVVVEKRPYAAISLNDILLYQGRPDANRPETKTMLHRAVAHDRYGWMMRGDYNRYTESWDRVTPQTYSGTVVAIFAFPQA
jgi:hypothetical protein